MSLMGYRGDGTASYELKNERLANSSGYTALSIIFRYVSDDMSRCQTV